MARVGSLGQALQGLGDRSEVKVAEEAASKQELRVWIIGRVSGFNSAIATSRSPLAMASFARSSASSRVIATVCSSLRRTRRPPLRTSLFRPARHVHAGAKALWANRGGIADKQARYLWRALLAEPAPRVTLLVDGGANRQR